MVPNALFKMPSPTFSENAGGQVPRVHSTYSEEKAAKALREYNAWMKSYGYAMNRLKTYNEPVLTGGAVREHDERAGHQTRAATTVRAAAGRPTRVDHRRPVGPHPAHRSTTACPAFRLRTWRAPRPTSISQASATRFAGRKPECKEISN